MNGMKQLLLGLACSIAFPLTAQWDLFPLGQRSYYRDMSLPGIQVDMVLMDSLRIDPQEGTYLYNRSSIHRQLFGSCAGAVVQGMTYMYQSMGYPTPMDSLLVRNDTAFYASALSAAPFYFLPRATIGQSWTVTSTYGGNAFSDITITCTGITGETFLGVTDSVKTFSLTAVGAVSAINDRVVRLSKQHGLVEYMPFEAFLYHPPGAGLRWYALLGMEADDVVHGYRQPAFADYFHLSAGDVLLWRYEEHPWYIAQPSITTYRRDSIVGVAVSAISVTYAFTGATQQADGSITTFQSGQVAYYRAALGGMLGAAPNDLANGAGASNSGVEFWGPEANMVWHSGPLQLSIAQNGVDTITSFAFESWGDFVDTACQVHQAVDWSYEWRADTRAGLNHYCANFGMGTACTDLIGSRINGGQQGNIALSITSNEGVAAGLSIHPNPATDRLFLPDTRLGGSKYNILDAFGRVVQSGTLAQDGIAVQDLPRGMYVLHIPGPGASMSARFVKE